MIDRLKLVGLIGSLRDAAYETGYIAGKIEAGVKQDPGYQADAIYKRECAAKDLLDEISRLINDRAENDQ